MNTIYWLAALSIVSPAQAYEFELTGQAKVTEHLFQQGTRSDETLDFKIYVHDCQWLIHGSAPKLSGRAYELGFDGTAQYCYSRMRSDETDGGQAAVLDPEQVPFNGVLKAVPVLWLAFTSSCYLDRHEKQLVTPYRQEPDRPVLEVQVERRADRARLPENIVFYTADGQEDAVYHASHFTNLAGLSIPLHFELTSYRDPGPGEPRRRQVTEHFEADIKMLRSACTLTSFRPQLNKRVPAEIRDCRLQFPPSTTPRGDTLDYVTNKWLSLSEVTNVPGFDRYMKFRTTGFKGPAVGPNLPDQNIR